MIQTQFGQHSLCTRTVALQSKLTFSPYFVSLMARVRDMIHFLILLCLRYNMCKRVRTSLLSVSLVRLLPTPSGQIEIEDVRTFVAIAVAVGSQLVASKQNRASEISEMCTYCCCFAKMLDFIAASNSSPFVFSMRVVYLFVSVTRSVHLLAP